MCYCLLYDWVCNSIEWICETGKSCKCMEFWGKGVLYLGYVFQLSNTLQLSSSDLVSLESEFWNYTGKYRPTQTLSDLYLGCVFQLSNTLQLSSSDLVSLESEYGNENTGQCRAY